MQFILAGMGLTVISALANGFFAFFFQKRAVLPLEHMWSLSFLGGYVILPGAILFLALPGWFLLLPALSGVWPLVILFGIGWGIASLFFIHGIDTMGISIGFAIIFGVTIAVGSLIPLGTRWQSVPSAARAVIIAGILVCVAGVFFSSVAAGKRNVGHTKASGGSRGLTSGVLVCVISGALSACANLSFDFAEPLMKESARFGMHPFWASIVRWVPAYISGFTVVLLYSIVKISKNRTWRRFLEKGASKDMRLAGIVAALLMLGQIPYGAGAYYLGNLGTSVGWAGYISLSVVVANVLGFFRGEWKNRTFIGTTFSVIGIAAFVAGVIVIAVGNDIYTNAGIAP